MVVGGGKKDKKPKEKAKPKGKPLSEGMKRHGDHIAVEEILKGKERSGTGADVDGR